MTNPTTNFASKLNTEVYGDVSKPRQITMEDIAKCRGSSQSMPSLLLNNLRVFFTKGKIVSDAKIRDILKKNGADNVDAISKLFKEDAPNISTIGASGTAKHAIIKDQKMAADLSKIFAKAATEIGLFTLDGKGEKWIAVSSGAEEAHIILLARCELEKHNPLELLRAAAFDSALESKKEKTNEKNETEIIKKDFISFLKEQKTIPKDVKDLNKTYESFMEVALKNTGGKGIQTLKNYSKDQSEQKYLLILKLEKTGLNQTEEPIATQCESLTPKELLQPYQKASLREKITEISSKDRSLHESQMLLGELFKDKDFAEPILARAAEQTQNKDMHNFISACLDLNLVYKTESRSVAIARVDALKARFLKEGAPEELNLTERVTPSSSFSDIYKHVVKTYIRNVLAEHYGVVNKHIEQFGVDAPKEQQKTLEKAPNYLPEDHIDDLNLFKKEK